MPRPLLRDGSIVADDWHYLDECAPHPTASLIVPAERWRAERGRWLSRDAPLGVLLGPTDKVEDLAADLPRLSLIGAEFTGPGDGRGYTQARQLREHWGYARELRATGYVRRDQLFFMARCGFNSFELPLAELAAAHAALTSFTAAYQAANDAGLPVALLHR